MVINADFETKDGICPKGKVPEKKLRDVTFGWHLLLRKSNSTSVRRNEAAITCCSLYHKIITAFTKNKVNNGLRSKIWSEYSSYIKRGA